MKKCFILVALISASLLCSAQDFSVPENYKLETADDYYSYENDVLQAAEWLISTPVNEQTQKRQVVNAFLLKWVSGSPYVHLGIGEIVQPFLDNSANQSLIIFMAGWIRYSLTTKNYDNMVEGNIAGIEAVITFYNKNKKIIGKEKGIEKYIKMQEKGTLKEYVTKIVEKEIKK